MTMDEERDALDTEPRMAPTPLTVLLVEDNPADAYLVRDCSPRGRARARASQ